MQELSTSGREALRSLFLSGLVRTSDLRREGREELHAYGLAEHRCGYSFLTSAGVVLAVDTGLARERDAREQARAAGTYRDWDINEVGLKLYCAWAGVEDKAPVAPAYWHEPAKLALRMISEATRKERERCASIARNQDFSLPGEDQFSNGEIAAIVRQHGHDIADAISVKP